MAMKRIGNVMSRLGVYGGVNVALNWAVILAKAGYHLDIIRPAAVGRPEIPFLSAEISRLLDLITEPEARHLRYQAVIATSWAIIAVMAEVNADHHAWFMQAYESQFIDPISPAQADFDELIASQIHVITSAHWLEQHVLRHYVFKPRQTFCVISGLDKSLWRSVPREPLRPGGRPVCFLVEGPATDRRKNIARTIRLLEELGSAYKWVGAAVDRSLIGSNCWGLEERVPYHRMPQIYGPADVLVKASNSEGMFGPPLEMFATGGTAAVWNVQGAEEYMTDRYNSLLVPMNSWSRLKEAILELAGDPERARDFQENALATTGAWPTWEDQADQNLAAIESLRPLGRCSLVRHVATNHFRSTIHSLAGADRASRALARLDELTSSRAWRFVRLLQRARLWVAPDGSRRWAILFRAGPAVWRAGHRIKLQSA
jgi:glycosyltransferase involved in cell wall biosynthesis